MSKELEQKLSFRASASVSGVSVQKAGEQGPVEENKPPPASSKAISFPVRPADGTMGRRCLVRANDFLVEVADRDLHHYDKMVNGGKVDSWTCVSFSPNLDAVRFCQELIDMCSSKGMVFDSRPLLPIQSAHPGQIKKTLFDIHAKSNGRLQSMDIAVKHLQLLIIILPDDTGSYSNIKRLCETELRIVSQCCQPRQAKRFNKQYLENLALKINAKVVASMDWPEATK